MAEAAAPERQLKRALSAFDLTCIGIGAIIGAGIFALAGTAAAGEQIEASIWKTPVLNFIISHLTHAELVFGRPGAGPAVMLSFVVAAIACGFAALCYAELASMIPVSGSAYTYSYATLGEIIAWVIGWDLILEYAVGNMAVAVGWSGYFVKLCGSLFNLKFPLWLVNDHTTATAIIAQGGDGLANYSSTTLPIIAGHTIAVNLPAFFVVAAVTVLLIYGIRESARTNTIIVIIKVAVVVFVIAFGAFMVHPTNWQPFLPNGVGGMMSGAAIVFFAFIGFDAVSTTAEETKNPQRDMPIGIIASLIICTGALRLDGGRYYGDENIHNLSRRFGGGSDRVRRQALGAGTHQCRGARWPYFGATGFSIRPAAHFHGHGARRVASRVFCKNSPAVPHTVHHDDLDWNRCRRRRHAYRHRVAGRSHEYRNAVCLHARLSWRDCFAAQRRRSSSPISGPARAIVPPPRRIPLHRADAESAAGNLGPFLCLAGDRALDLFPLQRAPQQTAPRHRRRSDRRYPAADHKDLKIRTSSFVIGISSSIPW